MWGDGKREQVIDYAFEAINSAAAFLGAEFYLKQTLASEQGYHRLVREVITAAGFRHSKYIRITAEQIEKQRLHRVGETKDQLSSGHDPGRFKEYAAPLEGCAERMTPTRGTNGVIFQGIPVVSPMAKGVIIPPTGGREEHVGGPGDEVAININNIYSGACTLNKQSIECDGSMNGQAKVSVTSQPHGCDNNTYRNHYIIFLDS